MLRTIYSFYKKHTISIWYLIGLSLSSYLYIGQYFINPMLVETKGYLILILSITLPFFLAIPIGLCLYLTLGIFGFWITSFRDSIKKKDLLTTFLWGVLYIIPLLLAVVGTCLIFTSKN